jgi:biotin carboxyl carrier protein
MDVQLRLGTRALRVSVVPDGDAVDVTVDGAAHRVARLAGSRAPAAAGVEDLALEIDGRPCRALVARVRERGSQRVLVAIAGRVYAFETGEESGGQHAGAGSGTVAAPMPGKVVAVLVAVGDTVAVGQPLVVLEAMKMESTLAAEVAGRVATVAAVAGATVAGGDVLVEIVASDG